MSAATDSLRATHDALFDLWFPIDRLPIPAAARTEIGAIAATVSAGLFDFLNGGPAKAMLAGLTDPSALSFYAVLQQSDDPSIKALLSTAGGFGGLDATDASGVFSFFFDGPAAPASTEMAMMLREVYLATIWDLPLAVPLAAIQAPVTFANGIDPALYAKLHYPELPESRLVYDADAGTIRAKQGKIDYLVIGAGPAGAATAHELRQAGKTVVLVEQGPFVVWGSMNTMSYPDLMFQRDGATTVGNGILVRSGQAMGGGSTVNIDLAFSPLEATIQSRIQNWIDRGWLDGDFYTQERISAAYQWVRNAIGTRTVTQSELNRDNRALWTGANAYGVDPSLYHLNRFELNYSPSPVTQKRDAARQLVLPAMQAADNPLSVLPDMAVSRLTFAPDPDTGIVRATGAMLCAGTPWTTYGNTIVDPCGLGIPPGTEVAIEADAVILSAGAIGSARILLETAKTASVVHNRRVGQGLIMHPSFPLIGFFDETINLLEGLDSATYLEAFGVTPGFIFETMSGLPAYGAVLIPGSAEDVYSRITRFNNCAGFGVMLVDTPTDSNAVTLNAQGQPKLTYALSDSDKQRFRRGIGIAIRMMFLAGAKEVIIPTNENVLERDDFDPMVCVPLTRIEDADMVERNIDFIPNRTVLTSAHLQATCKMGTSAETSVASTRQRIWNCATGDEIPNLYLMDSSMFPTSVGANPMQSLYTFAKIFSERLLGGMDTPVTLPFVALETDHATLGPEPVHA